MTRHRPDSASQRLRAAPIGDPSASALAAWPGALARMLACLLATVLALHGCAPGSSDGVGSSGTGASTAGIQVGSVSGFGSVIIEGNAYDDSAATYTIDVDPSAPVAAGSSDVKLGMQADASFDGTEHAVTVRVGASAVGTIDSKTSDGFVLVGQTVRVATSGALTTVLEGIASATDLAVGDRVAVYGPRDASEVITATRIERVDPAATVYTRVAGIVGTVDNTARTMTIGGLTVTWTTATKLLPAGTSFTAGQRVAVWSSATPVGATLAAGTIATRDPTLFESAPVRVGGVVRAYDRGANQFVLQGLTIDAKTATFSNGASSDLANGKVVRVTGTVSGSLIKAKTVAIMRDAADLSNEITGVITDYVSSTSFRVRGSPIDASAATIAFVNGGAANLADGVLVKIKGQLADGTLLPTRIEFLTQADTRTTAFLGTVSGYASTTGAFTMQGVSMRLSSTATFSNASGGGTATRSDFGDGDFATVQGSFQSGVFVVDAVVFRGASQVIPVSAQGAAYAVDLVAQTFRLNLIPVRYTSGTRIDGSLVDLKPGTPVKVEGSVQAGVLVATRVTIRP
jgi:hypothetical protein